MITILLIAVVSIAALAVLLVSQSGGPRVTTIETRHERDEAKEGE